MIRNRIVHKLLNQTGFPVFEPEFARSVELPKYWYEVQKRLQLHIPISKTHSYLFRCLSILESFPGLKAELGQDTTTYSVFDFVPSEEFRFIFRFSDFGAAQGKLKSEWGVFPLDTSYRLTVNFDASNRPRSIGVKTENRELDLPILSSTFTNNVTEMTVEWGDFVPIEGNLLFLGNILNNLDMEFTYTPARLINKSWVEYLEASTDYMKVLNDVGAMDKYSICNTALEKLAVIIYSLAKANRNV